MNRRLGTNYIVSDESSGSSAGEGANSISVIIVEIKDVLDVFEGNMLILKGYELNTRC